MSPLRGHLDGSGDLQGMTRGEAREIACVSECAHARGGECRGAAESISGTASPGHVWGKPPPAAHLYTARPASTSIQSSAKSICRTKDDTRFTTVCATPRTTVGCFRMILPVSPESRPPHHGRQPLLPGPPLPSRPQHLRRGRTHIPFTKLAT